MQWNRVKKASELALPGVSVSFDVHSSSIMAVYIRVGDRVAKIALENYYEMYVYTPAVSEKFRVSAVVAGIPVTQDFDEERDANNKRDELSAIDPEAKVEKIVGLSDSVQSNCDIPF